MSTSFKATLTLFPAVACVVALSAASGAMADVFNGTGGPLADNNGSVNGVTTFSLNVANAGVVGAFNGITFTTLSHTWVGDLQITLTLPDATTVSIVDRIGVVGSGFGDSSNFLGNYTFADGGADIWAIATIPGNGTSFNIPSGTYAATGAGSGAAINLNALLAGKSVTGLWTVTVTDFAGGDTGSLGSWSINVGIVPAPGAIALLMPLCGLAGGVGRRRRA